MKNQRSFPSIIEYMKKTIHGNTTHKLVTESDPERFHRNRPAHFKKHLPGLLTEAAWQQPEVVIVEWEEKSLSNMLTLMKLEFKSLQHRFQNTALDSTVLYTLFSAPLSFIAASARIIKNNSNNCTLPEATEITSHIFVPDYDWEVTCTRRSNGLRYIEITGRRRSRMAA